MIKIPEIDKEKLQRAMEIIDQSADLMERTGWQENDAVKSALEKLEKELRAVTGKESIDIIEYNEYWSHSDLEDVARSAVMPAPQKLGLSAGEICEIIRGISDCSYGEAETEYLLGLLELETGLDVIDYIFWPDHVGLELSASVEEITDKIFLDMAAEE